MGSTPRITNVPAISPTDETLVARTDRAYCPRATIHSDLHVGDGFPQRASPDIDELDPLVES
jgi:hypothetical protein